MNLVVDNVDDVISELKFFKQVGGGAVCDISPIGVRLEIIGFMLITLLLRNLY